MAFPPQSNQNNTSSWQNGGFGYCCSYFYSYCRRRSRTRLVGGLVLISTLVCFGWQTRHFSSMAKELTQASTSQSLDASRGKAPTTNGANINHLLSSLEIQQEPPQHPESRPQQPQQELSNAHYAFVSRVPRVDMPWPPLGRNRHDGDSQAPPPAASSQRNKDDNITISILVPGIATSYESDLATLFPTIASQTVPALDVVLVLSGVHRVFGINETAEAAAVAANRSNEDTVLSREQGTQFCETVYQYGLQHLSSSSSSISNNYHGRSIPYLTVLCVGEVLTPGMALNAAGKLAQGTIYSMLSNAHDQLFSVRNQIIYNVFACSSNLLLFTHSCMTNEHLSSAVLSTSRLDQQHSYIQSYYKQQQHKNKNYHATTGNFSSLAALEQYGFLPPLPTTQQGRRRASTTVTPPASATNNTWQCAQRDDPLVEFWTNHDFQQRIRHEDTEFWAHRDRPPFHPRSMYPGQVTVRARVLDSLPYGPATYLGRGEEFKPHPYAQEQVFLRKFFHAYPAPPPNDNDPGSSDAKNDDSPMTTTALFLDRPLTTCLDISNFTTYLKIEPIAKKQKKQKKANTNTTGTTPMNQTTTLVKKEK